ncbi:MAG: hypothetical protein EOL90_03045 [Spartobacteria bacterium]|nr:hypothetical protein [Spartobacteria bacterium]
MNDPPSKMSAPPPASAIKLGSLGLLLFCATFLLFSPALRYGLVDFDDQIYVASHPLVMEGFSADHVRSALTSFRHGLYSPLLWFSYGLDAALLGASPAAPWGFHFTNMLFHALNSALLYFLLWTFCRKPWRAFFFAALWALHPLRVESVAWVTERKDVLSGFFGLLSIWAYLHAGLARGPAGSYSKPRLPPYLASLLMFFLGLLVKPTLVPIPGALLLLDFWPLRRLEFTGAFIRRFAPRLLAEKIPYFILAGLAAIGASAAHQTMHGITETPWAIRILAIPVHYAFYLVQFVWPRRLAPLYPDVPPSTPWLWPAVLALAILTVWIWISRWRRPERLVGWFFFIGFLVPAIGLVRFGAQSIADRFTYLPAIGLSIALLSAWPSREGRRQGAGRLFRILVSAGVLVALAGTTLRLLPAWRGPASLHAHILSVFPDNPSALGMRSSYLIRTAGDFKGAQAGFDRIIRSGSFNHEVLGGKARCLAALQGPAAAQAFLRQAPSSPNPYARHAVAWDIARYSLMLRQYDDAIRFATLALECLPAQWEQPAYLHLLIMVAAFEKGDTPLALEHARRFPAYADKPALAFADLLPYYLHQWTEFHRADAYAYFQRLIAATPDQTRLLNNIAWGLATAEWSPAPPGEVLALAQQVCAAFPTPNPGALDTLAAAQANAGDFGAAGETIRQAIQLISSPANPEIAQWKERLQARMALYRNHCPYREDAFSRLLAAQFGKDLPVTNKKAAP